ncbi:hypothetical protein EVAR_41645_1 [Eumeta japonica]|uniref:RNA-directed DNA polymerase from mobile element jockey n=1 Tax=Eumeta variegata TaxID=151549 RepID=A0A4C1WZC6_EUMVA|nr:hypothetical protein EVAR_41645_1 [Eumeta japonica]
MTKKLKYDNPVVHMHGEQLSLIDEIRFLGLTTDKKLMFIPHCAKYASCAWAPATRKLRVQKMFNVVQRSVALKACRAHPTVSHHCVLILSRLVPLDIRMREGA